MTMGNDSRDQNGIFGKFRVERVDGRCEEKDNFARYFVLNYVGDRYARLALRTYIGACQEDYPLLAADLRTQLAETEDAFNRFGLHHDCMKDDSQ